LSQLEVDSAQGIILLSIAGVGLMICFAVTFPFLLITAGFSYCKMRLKEVLMRG